MIKSNKKFEIFVKFELTSDKKLTFVITYDDTL